MPGYQRWDEGIVYGQQIPTYLGVARAGAALAERHE
jgi:hypothetical protein